jgi:hypothetical protein
MRFRQRFSDTIRARLAQEAGNISKAVNDALQHEAQQIQKKAREYAPFETGALMEAIKVEGMERRTAWAVYIDRNAPDDTERYTVGTYFLRLHEESDWKPGPGTVPPRGPKYLERAYRERARGFARRMQQIAAAALQGGTAPLPVVGQAARPSALATPSPAKIPRPRDASGRFIPRPKG